MDSLVGSETDGNVDHCRFHFHFSLVIESSPTQRFLEVEGECNNFINSFSYFIFVMLWT